MEPGPPPDPARDLARALWFEDLDALLDGVRAGSTVARDELYRRMYERLRTCAHRIMGPRRDGTMQPTELVGEAYLRVEHGEAVNRPWQDLGHFFKTLASAMRSVIIDRERRRHSRKREQPGERIDLDDPRVVHLHDRFQERAEDLLDLEAALVEFARKKDPLRVQIVELRFFLGLTLSEIAAVLKLSDSTVDRHFRETRAWLYRHMSGESLSVPA